MENRDYFYEETIDIKEIIFKVWRHWKIYLACILLGGVLVFLKNKSEQAIYETSTTLLINDRKSTIDPQSLLGLDFYNNQNQIQNEIEILKSQSLIKKAFEHLNFGVSYYLSDNFITKELYNNSPFIVHVDSNYLQPINYLIGVKIINKDSLSISFNAETIQLFDFKTKKTYNNLEISENTIAINAKDSLKSNLYGFSINLTHWFNKTEHANKEFYFKLNNFQTNLNEFQNISFENIDKSSVINILLQHHNLNKSVDFLNELTNVYLKKELSKKNTVAEKSLQFIEAHLSEINDSLFVSEKSLQEFQASKSALNIDFQTQKMFESLEDLQNQKSEALIGKKYYIYLLEALNQNKLVTDIIAPSLMNINNPILTTQITNLINIQSEVNNIKISSGAKNPYLRTLVSKIDNSKNVIVEYVQNETNSIEIKLTDIDLRIDEVIEKINSLPKTQRELFNFERNFKVFDNIYTFLLQKRSETLLAKASNVPINEVLDKASNHNYKIVSNKTKLNYLIGFIISILLPSIYVYIKYYFNSKILTDKDIENETDLPILGHIIRTKKSDNAFLDPKSPIAESFRMLRTNLDFARKSQDNQTILVTSTMQGEGKSFVSGNLARSLAINNKRTILLVFDLRKPMLYFNLPESKYGLTNFLINKCEINDIIQSSEIENLDIINAGSLPPNPAELITSDRTTELLTYLQKNYDFVIIDTPPIGIISDGLSLTKYANITLFVTRYNYTRIKPFSNLLKRIKSHNIENLNLVTNSLELNNKGYGYGYTYGEYGGYKY